MLERYIPLRDFARDWLPGWMTSWLPDLWWVWAGSLLHILLLVVVLLVALAFLLLADRKIWAAVQMRRHSRLRKTSMMMSGST